MWGSDGVYALATDSATNSYIGGVLALGEIQSDPVIAATEPYGYIGGAQDAFVAKLTPSNSLAWYICLGGYDKDCVTGLATGPNESLYAVGLSERYNLPPEAEADQDSGINACLWSIGRTTGANTLLVSVGDVNLTNGFNAVAVDTNGYIYAVGYTSQSNLAQNVSGYSLNGTNYGTQLKGGSDACVLKVAPNGAIVWFHYLGGTNDDAATACAVTPDGSVYVGGETRSPGWVSTASGTPGPANKDGFVVKLNASGAHVWSTFFSGSGNDAIAALSLNPATGTLLVGGTAAASDFLAATARLNAHAGGNDGFVVKLTDNGSTFTNAWCRFLGGGGADRVSALAALSDGLALVGGATRSGGWLAQSGSSVFRGAQDGFLCSLDSAGELMASTYMGGASNDEVRALAPAPGAVLAAGSTCSDGWISGGFWTEWNKIDDAEAGIDVGFVGKWISEPGAPPAITGEPDDLTVQEGQPATFLVTATGYEPMTYRWYRNGVPATGLTSNAYVIAAAAATNNNDTYSCLVSNIFGGALSRAARLTVIPKGTLAVTLAPAAAVAQGARWRLGSGATWFASGESTNLPAGTYSVVFTNLTGWSAPATLASVQVASGATTATSGVYTAVLPAAERTVTGTNVTVMVRAPAGLSTWTLVENLAPGLTPTSWTAGGDWNSGARTLTFTGVEATTNTLSYTVSCPSSGVYAVSGAVTPQPANISVAVTGDAAVIRANFIRKVTGRTVSITVTQPLSNVRWHVYEYPPETLAFTITAGETLVFESDVGYIDWTKRGTGEIVSYEVTGAPGTYILAGEGLIGAAAEPIFGDSVLVIPEVPPPQVPPPDILSFAPVSGAYSLTFTSVVNQAYMILTNATLSVTNGWADCLPVTGGDGVTVRQVPAAAPQLFYRVRVVQ
jgi:hypothetical protein